MWSMSQSENGVKLKDVMTRVATEVLQSPKFVCYTMIIGAVVKNNLTKIVLSCYVRNHDHGL